MWAKANISDTDKSISTPPQSQLRKTKSLSVALPTIAEPRSVAGAASGDDTPRRFYFDTPAPTQTKNEQQPPDVQDASAVDYTKPGAKNDRPANDFSYNDEDHNPLVLTHQQSEVVEHNLSPRPYPLVGGLVNNTPEISREYNVVVMGDAYCGKTQLIL